MGLRAAAGTLTNTTANDAAMASVVGTPRDMRFSLDSPSGVGGGGPGVPGTGDPDPRARVAMAIPTAKGTATARASHPSRTVQDGTKAGMGTKASTSAMALGQTIPSTRIGQAAAVPTSTDSWIFSAPLVVPKSASTAHPNKAPATRPSERLMRAKTAWMMAIAQPQRNSPAIDPRGGCAPSTPASPHFSIAHAGGAAGGAAPSHHDRAGWA